MLLPIYPTNWGPTCLLGSWGLRSVSWSSCPRLQGLVCLPPSTCHIVNVGLGHQNTLIALGYPFFHEILIISHHVSSFFTIVMAIFLCQNSSLGLTKKGDGTATHFNHFLHTRVITNRYLGNSAKKDFMRKQCGTSSD